MDITGKELIDALLKENYFGEEGKKMNEYDLIDFLLESSGLLERFRLRDLAKWGIGGLAAAGLASRAVGGHTKRMANLSHEHRLKTDPQYRAALLAQKTEEKEANRARNAATFEKMGGAGAAVGRGLAGAGATLGRAARNIRDRYDPEKERQQLAALGRAASGARNWVAKQGGDRNAAGGAEGTSPAAPAAPTASPAQPQQAPPKKTGISVKQQHQGAIAAAETEKARAEEQRQINAEKTLRTGVGTPTLSRVRVPENTIQIINRLISESSLYRKIDPDLFKDA